MPVQTQAITKGYEVDSLCECQGILGATLNSERLVLEGWVRRAGERERTPANTVGQEADRFDIVWLCTLCGRKAGDKVPHTLMHLCRPAHTHTHTHMRVHVRRETTAIDAHGARVHAGT